MLQSSLKAVEGNLPSIWQLDFQIQPDLFRAVQHAVDEEGLEPGVWPRISAPVNGLDAQLLTRSLDDVVAVATEPRDDLGLLHLLHRERRDRLLADRTRASG